MNIYPKNLQHTDRTVCPYFYKLDGSLHVSLPYEEKILALCIECVDSFLTRVNVAILSLFLVKVITKVTYDFVGHPTV